MNGTGALVELVDVVDADDRVVAVKPRAELVDGVDRWRMSVVLVCDTAGRVLLAQRSKDKRHDPNLWTACVAGTVESGDSYIDTAVRETAEEIGLQVEPGELVELFCGRWDRPDQLRCAGVYLLRRDVAVEDLEWDRREAQAMQWFDLDDALAQIAAEPERFSTRAGEILAMLD